MGLKIISEQFRDEVLKLNLKTPPDIVLGLTNLSGAALFAAYQDALGKDAVIKTDKASVTLTDPGNVVDEAIQPRNRNLNRNLPTIPNVIGEDTVIGDRIISDLSGRVDDVAETERTRLFNKNRPLNINDPSENDPLFSFLSQGGYTYTSLLQSIGQLTLINDLDIPNAISVSLQSNQTPDVSLQLQLQQNRFFPVEPNQFESRILTLRPDPFSTPYINAYNSGIFNYNQPQRYEPSSFLNLRTTSNPLSIITNTADPLSFLLNGGTPPLQDETLLMNIAALELKFNFESRIKQAIERETLGRTNLDEALTNPIAAANIIRNPFGWFNLFERNNTISVPSSTLGRAAQFTASLAGLTNPLALDFALSTDDDLSPKCFGNELSSGRAEQSTFSKFVNSLLGKSASRKENRDAYFLRRTGEGQRFSLFYNVKKNKYQPDYLDDEETRLFLGQNTLQRLRRLGGVFGLGAGDRPEGSFYIGNKNRNEDPLYLLQDADGHQVRSNQANIEALKLQKPGHKYEEPGITGEAIDNGNQGVSEYGSIRTNFIWKSSLKNENDKPFNGSINDEKLSFNKYKNDKFRECSILYVTSQLLEKGIQSDIGVFNSPIDQSVTKFYDGYDFMSRANSTISPNKTPKINKQGEIIGYNYSVPGLDINGKRNPKKMYDEAELCRVWTKDRPYSKITDLVRYKELIRKERNSVIDRFGNYNVYPTELNVNNSGGSRRARKYMFSIENLAWRDAWDDKGKMGLPECEKGPNGGRVMWFPPYEINFADNNSANWTSHQFLGRPEPIYTYNNSERTGTLSWKLVVDHPSVLNLITQKELATLNDNEVDELLSAFWAGCLEFDIFELARIWNQFSQSDIEYFKNVIGGLNAAQNNQVLKEKIEQVRVYKQTQNIDGVDISSEIPTSKINGFNLFFENDVPLSPTVFKDKKSNVYDTGSIESFDILFKKYYELGLGVNNDNSQKTKTEYRPTNINPDLINYDLSIGSKSGINYMGVNEVNPKHYGFEAQYKAIQEDLSDPKYKGFDLNIKINAYASPIAPDSNSSTYNKQLAIRRFLSVIKWLVGKVMRNDNLGKMYYDNGVEVTNENLTSFINEQSNNTNLTKLIFKRDNGKVNDGKDDITFILTEVGGIDGETIIKDITPNPLSVKENIYFTVLTEDSNTNQRVEYCCFANDEISNKVISENLLPQFSSDRIGSVTPKGKREYKDIVCSVSSIQSAYARRVTLNIEVSKKTDVPKKTEPIDEEFILQSSFEAPLNEVNVTKRDIAQRIINKMITECDYFELLRKDSPTVYESLKQKLKFFQPAFHAMTPEGLNARLTFLQQCLRPGETIRRKVGDDFCDAANTAFGKPPICVLRIGDFYHTKIAIDSLNISYEPLVWDLNPEGIGAQPMIANVSLNFKYIGGSGLRKHVDELQNALSFNYYANTDIYDSRTFANNDEFERNLINLERSFFDDNVLDLIPIVASAERIVPSDFQSNIPYGTIGIITKKLKPTSPGGVYSFDIPSTQSYNSNIVYQPFSVVSFNGDLYLRKADDENNLSALNTLDGSLAPITNTKYWEPVIWRNYGEQAFALEFNTKTQNPNSEDQFLDKTFFNWYEIQYRDLFKLLYETYGDVINGNVEFNTINKEENIILDLILNKNYNKNLDNIMVDLDGDTTGVENGKYKLFNSFDKEAEKKNYVEYYDFNKISESVSQSLTTSKINPLKLHLYPQNYLYKIGDGKSVVPTIGGIFNDTQRFNPGSFTGGFINQNNKTKAEIAGFYLKNYNNHLINIPVILDELYDEMNSKIKLDLEHFWFYNESGYKLFDEYVEYFGLANREIFHNYLSKKLKDYVEKLKDDKDEIIRNIIKNTTKLGGLLSGISVVLDGYDIKNDETKSFKYEVIPNQYELNVQPESLFGYDPYLQYKTLSLNNFETISLSNVRTVIYDAQNDINSKLKFLSLGNGMYFFKQISKDNLIQQISGNNYTFDNNLPESVYLKIPEFLISPNTPNFEVVNGITLNTQLNKNALNGVTNTLNIQPGVGEDTKGSYQEIYKMKYTFEKLNYEFFEFSNKNLDIMLNDNFVEKSFDLNIIYDENYNFNKQLSDLNLLVKNNPLTFEDWVTANNIDLIIGSEGLIMSDYQNYLDNLEPKGSVNSIFYSGNKTNLNDIEIEYYTLNENLVTNITQPIINNINDFIKYEFNFSKKFIENSSNSSFVFSDLVNKKIEMSGLIDLLFLGFFSELNNNDKNIIFEEIKSNKDKNIRVNDNGKNKTQLVNNRLNKIEKILKQIFTRISDYTSLSNKKIKPLYDEYNKTKVDVIKKMNKILINSENENISNSNTIANNLLKGGIKEYTLVVKDTINTTSFADNNYNVFTKTKSEFNIITQNQEPEIIENINSDDSNRYKKI